MAVAHHLPGRPIQSAYLVISHVNSLFCHPPPSLNSRIFLRLSSAKHCFSQIPSLSSYRTLLCTATFQPPTSLTKDKQQLRSVVEENYEEYAEGEEYEEEDRSDEEGADDDNEDFSEEKKEVVSSLEQKQAKNTPRRIPQLTVTEKKQLSSYAHSLGKKLISHQVGKSGVTLSVENSISRALEANELIKLKVHGTCPDELDVVSSRLQEATGSVVVRQIGRTFILYRPSQRKDTTAETKKPPQRPQRPQTPQRRRISKSAGWKNRNA